MAKTYTVQYSTPGKNPAVSEWQEHTKQIQANIDKFSHNRKGSWMILDCWETHTNEGYVSLSIWV